MAQSFLACDRDQELLLPPSLRGWLPDGHLAWFVIDAVAALDLRPLYWQQVQMQRLAGEGVTVLGPPDANKRAGARPGWNGGLYAFMRRVLATDHGGALYAKRKGMMSRCSPTRSSTAASIAAYAADGPQRGRNGG
jgi:hypothetical protein